MNRLSHEDSAGWRGAPPAAHPAAADPADPIAADSAVTSAAADDSVQHVAPDDRAPTLPDFALAFEHAPIGQAVLSLDGRFLTVNRALCALLRYRAEELLARSMSDLLEADGAAAYQAEVDRLVTGGPDTAGRQQEQRFRTGTGDLVVGSQSITVVARGEGVARRVVVQILDLSITKEQEIQLARERSRLQEAQVIGRMGSWEIDIATQRVTWSDAMFKLRGIDKATFGGDYSAATSMVHPEDRQRVRTAVEDAARTGEQMSLRYRASRVDDRSERWFDARFKGLYEDGVLVTLAGTVVDVTEDVIAEEKIRSAYAFQQAIVTASPDILFVYDLPSSRTVWSSRSVLETLGYPPPDDPDAADALLAALVPEADRTTVHAALHSTRDAEDQDVVSVSYRLLDAPGNLRWFSRRTTTLSRTDDGAVAQLVGVLRDITEAKAAEQQLQHSALHDELTGLANRALLLDRIQGALVRSARDRREVSVLFCDLDGFKKVNDTAGHAAGDAVLIETSRRLESVLREGDTVARVGGDEFVLVVEPWNRPDSRTGPPGGQLISDRELGPQIADRVATAMRVPIEHNGVQHVVSASIGITYGPMGPSSTPVEATADAVLQDADAAMYIAKRRGKDRAEVFEHGMRTDVVERGRVERVLRRALRAGRSMAPDFAHPGTDDHPTSGARPASTAAPASRLQPDRIWVVYQPIFANGTGALTGFEALARLADANGSQIPPEVFVPIAEETGQIPALGAFMLDQAVGQLAAWRRRLSQLSTVTMAVNVSAQEVGDASLAKNIGRALSAHGLHSRDLVLELTETALLGAGRSSISTLRALRSEGMGIAIDDFGVGFASLHYLATLPVSGVKIDKPFTAGLPTDLVSCKIVNAIAALAADLELDCTVEGVETAAQRTALPQGVRLQGWLTGRPVEADGIDCAALIGGLVGPARAAGPGIPGYASAAGGSTTGPGASGHAPADMLTPAASPA